MNNKSRFQSSALHLFNTQGVLAVSMREVARDADASLGNLTYHFPSKEALIRQLWTEMIEEHTSLSTAFFSSENLLESMLLAPAFTFEITLRYRFLFTDYLDIIRSFPAFGLEVHKINQQRMERMQLIFPLLQQKGLLRNDLSNSDFSFIMETSGILRTFFFTRPDFPTMTMEEARLAYIRQVNALLFSYLTASGAALFRTFDSNLIEKLRSLPLKSV